MFHPLIFMIDLIMNLMSRLHHKLINMREKISFSRLFWKYIRIICVGIREFESKFVGLRSCVITRCNWCGWLRFKVAKNNFKSQLLNIKNQEKKNEGLEWIVRYNCIYRIPIPICWMQKSIGVAEDAGWVREPLNWHSLALLTLRKSRFPNASKRRSAYHMR